MNEVIKQLQIHKGLTQCELAKMSGLQQSTICRIEKDCSKTSWNKILKLLVALKLVLKNLLTNYIHTMNTKYMNFYH
ncbi:hypothetical protein SKUN_00285 [Spiroplasma kunkelii CR2-3x]|uniref:HTH cro/C1-type domain-containing protein n=1 Tax=Spiroplasma kunkelii CR2-3x TaxID=273035 RepID=A0A0K2JF44_SPIKU|nr:helix-turn-helix transcriptional regulator [Spiroplasma kunkelii]ALA97205.1 hypothetical protein SKUN_00285 [Spiroplasma kunkelii CR2-3x]